MHPQKADRDLTGEVDLRGALRVERVASSRVEDYASDPRALSPEDLAILRLESEKIAGHTCKVITLDAPPGGGSISEGLREHITGRLERFPRMTERLSDDYRRPAWVPDDRFDVRKHVLVWERAAPASRADLLDIVAELMTTRLDRSRPLWSIHLVDLDEGRVALVLLIHHCMADGTTAVRLCSEVLWDPLGAIDEPSHPSHAQAPAPTSAHLNLRGCIRRELMPKAADTPFDRHPSARRRVATARANLAELKRIGKEVGDGATVNDVVLCAVGGGLRSWLERHGGPLREIRVKVPVSLHDQHEQSGEFGNRDSFMVVDVGTDEPDSAARLRRITLQTREMKTQHDAQSLDRLFQKLRHVSSLASQALSSWSANPHVFTINVSNVPGPRVPVAVMDGAVRELFTLAEIANRHALRVAAISLGDELSFGLCADAVAVEAPETIAAGIEAELAALSLL